MKFIFWALLVSLLTTLIFRNKKKNLAPYIVSAILFATFFWLTIQIPETTGFSEVFIRAWSSHFGAEFAFKLDGLSLVMTVLISFIGSGVFLYSANYMRFQEKQNSFYLTLAVFTSAMFGLVLADNMILFFLFWETTSICSFLLVGTKHQNSTTRESARKALFVTVGGGLLLLVGFLLISIHGQSLGLTLAESLRFSYIDRSIISSSHFSIIVVCLAIGIATKSAQVPFHIWLPSAMAGPTPVSSFLHSATMVKAGVYLLARLTPSLGANELWTTTFITIGASSMVVGAVLSASQRDIKKILAFSTIAVLGILIMLLGIGTDIAIKAAVVFLVAHALYKAALFQIIGNIDYATGSRDLKSLGSLARVMPITTTAAVLAALSMAGAPPLFGFFGKELAYLAKLQLSNGGIILIPLAVFTNTLLVGLAISICYRPFWSKNQLSIELKKIPLGMSMVPFVLAASGLFVGLFPAVFDKYLGTQMASVISGDTLVMKLKLWHGVNLESLYVLALSIATLATGIFIAVKIKPIIVFLSKNLNHFEKIGPDKLYNYIITNTPRVAASFIDKLQCGRLSKYIYWTLAGAFIFISAPLSWAVSNTGLEFRFTWIDAIMLVAICLPATGLLIVKNQVSRLILIGASGFGVVLLFTLFSAPDLALTQLLVDALVLILTISLIQTLGFNAYKIRGKQKLSSFALAFVIATFLTLFLLIDIPELSEKSKVFFLENSYLKAYGKNVVNVILVDFRALDTFGEVIVVAIAGLGCGSLIPGKKGASSE